MTLNRVEKKRWLRIGWRWRELWVGLGASSELLQKTTLNRIVHNSWLVFKFAEEQELTLNTVQLRVGAPPVFCWKDNVQVFSNKRRPHFVWAQSRDWLVDWYNAGSSYWQWQGSNFPDGWGKKRAWRCEQVTSCWNLSTLAGRVLGRSLFIYSY